MADTHMHTVSSFEGELQRLSSTLARMGGLVERQMGAAIDALVKRDAEIARRVITDDETIDELENEISTQAVRLLALRQPMSIDLREVICAIRMASDLERLADHSVNIAKRSVVLGQSGARQTTEQFGRLARPVQTMLHDVLNAYFNRSLELAQRVRNSDAEVDALYTGLFNQIVEYMREDPDQIVPYTHLLFIAKNIERMGDHATNMAETGYYLMTGERLTDTRPKLEDGGISRDEVTAE